MSSVWNKLDTGLSVIYANYLRVREHGPLKGAPVHPLVADGGRLVISLDFDGDLSDIEALGFETVQREGEGQATGSIDLADLARLTEHPGVLKMSFGLPAQVSLDQSIPNIEANKVWTLDLAAQKFADTTGAGAIVGVIDTGIDYKHRFFRQTLDGVNPPFLAPIPKTRILSIWDQSLDPLPGKETSPSPADIGYANSYGVEYTAATIDANLTPPPPPLIPPSLRHTDSRGHGTHVASIAAGNGRGHGATNFKYIGVAPEADLIVVKLLDLSPVAGVAANTLSYDLRFQHAVNYILNVAKHKGRPVVVNYSAGVAMGPHDGWTLSEIYLRNKFSGATGQAFVVAAGNQNGIRRHATISLPHALQLQNAPGPLTETVIIPLDFSDTRATAKPGSYRVDVYYPATGVDVSVIVTLPADGPFAVSPVVAGPSVGGAHVTDVFKGMSRYTLIHSSDDTGTVKRKVFQMIIEPDWAGDYTEGSFALTITYTVQSTDPTNPAAANRAMHLWCETDLQRVYGFKIGAVDAQFANVSAEDLFLIDSPAGAENTLCVASYDAAQTIPDLTHPVPFTIASDSSSGPLADYGSGLALPPKPDLAAPGVGIDAAWSGDYMGGSVFGDAASIRFSGTSMAAPHVAGAVALMLAKKRDLTPKAIEEYLKLSAVTYNAAQPLHAGVGRLSAKKAFDRTPH